MRALTTFGADSILAQWFRDGAAFSPANLFIALFTAGQGDDLTGEVDGANWTNYARVSTAAGATPDWSVPAGASGGRFVENTAVIDFGTATVSGSQPRVKGVGICDAATAGNIVTRGPLIINIAIFFGEATGDLIHAPGHGFTNGMRVVFYGDSLPTGISADTEYFVISATADTFQVSETDGGAAVTITADGVGNVGQSRFFTVEDTNPVSIPVGDLDVLLR